jgi:hypothetical protein
MWEFLATNWTTALLLMLLLACPLLHALGHGHGHGGRPRRGGGDG